MTRTRISLVVGVLGVLAFAACSSDEPSSDDASTTTTSSPSSSVVPGGTTTTAAAAATTTSIAVATDATVVGRVVDDPTNNVHGGDTGPAVIQIQYILVGNGYKIGVDGVYGPVTEAAVKDFQKKNGLTEDGIVGPVTWSRLEASVGVTTTSGPAGTALAGTTTTLAGATTTTTVG